MICINLASKSCEINGSCIGMIFASFITVNKDNSLFGMTNFVRDAKR